VFYFGIFDGHGGAECSEFLRDELHEYVQDAALAFELQSSLKRRVGDKGSLGDDPSTASASTGYVPVIQGANRQKIAELEKALLLDWKDLVGGYFRRFRPRHFSYTEDGQLLGSDTLGTLDANSLSGASIEEVMEYAFLKADFDFVTAQVAKRAHGEKPLNEGDLLHNPSKAPNKIIGGPKCFKGGSTSSVAMISTPTPTPFWHPSAPASLLVSHVGDTRVLLCSTATGLAMPLTMDHRPSYPIEGNRLRRYAASFVTDSFGEERMDGLANTRAFGDIQSKRVGVSAEPEIRRVEMKPAEYSFLVLMSDGVSGTLTDQEVVDIVKEAKTPDQGASDVVSFATEVSKDGDNATCLVVRLGGWERRQEGGLGSMGTKEERDWRKQEASNPRSRRQ
jgi:protein phosphatase PTC6